MWILGYAAATIAGTGAVMLVAPTIVATAGLGVAGLAAKGVVGGKIS
jgi:hypothetical protein